MAQPMVATPTTTTSLQNFLSGRSTLQQTASTVAAVQQQNQTALTNLSGAQTSDQSALASLHQDGVVGQVGPVGQASPRKTVSPAGTGSTPAKTSTSPRPYSGVLSGSARAVSGNALVVDGHYIQLEGLTSPGVGAVCHSHGVPWACGDEATASLMQIAARGAVCTVHGSLGSCTVYGSDDDVASQQALRGEGYGGGRLMDATSMAKRDHRGIWSGDSAP